jgi:putative hydrolase of the HAD superfamily
VISASPFDAFARYEAEQGLPTGFIRGLNATNPDANAWAGLERGELDLEGFAELFEAEARAAGGRIDARAVIGILSGEIRPAMVEAIRRCHQQFKTGLLTNNFTVREAPTDRADVMDHFDIVVESSRTGCRKPDPRFYQIACELLGIEPQEAVFLDDLGVNLKPARAMGMRTIKVIEPDAALIELEQIVGFDLR